MDSWKDKMSVAKTNNKVQTFRTGDLAYFRECKNMPNPLMKETRFKGHGFGLFLGHVSTTDKVPTNEDAIKLLGATGFISFDNICEFLTPEQAQTCIEKFEEKYYSIKDTKPAILSPEGKVITLATEETKDAN